jgi:hypothetical protein
MAAVIFETTRTRCATRYVGPVDSSEDSNHEAAEDSPLEAFLEQPAYHADEDTVDVSERRTLRSEPAGNRWQRFRRKFTHFMFEKEPSQYSSISPRTPDGKRTKIFFFNGNGRGR